MNKKNCPIVFANDIGLVVSGNNSLGYILDIYLMEVHRHEHVVIVFFTSRTRLVEISEYRLKNNFEYHN